ncbi:hypothetical protein KIF24_10265 [Micromonospora sp. Llam7]|nr:hypothetical protein [Micromonospora tarapacensis]MBX7266369.1 hypothetical protein [Micromonospora tarapacensis]
MTPDDRTPYRPHGRTTRLRTTLIVVAVIVLVAVGLTLHVAGVLPPK